MSPKLKSSSKKPASDGTDDMNTSNDSSAATTVPRCGPRAHLSRKSAGRRELFPGYLNTEKAVDDLEASESETEKHSNRTTKGRSAKRLKLYHPSTPPMLSPGPPETIADDTSSLVSSSDRATVPKEVNLTFNIPPGHTGPFVIKLDLNSLLTTPKENHDPTYSTNEISFAGSHPPNGVSNAVSNKASWIFEDANKKGFFNLPFEIRNRIYFHVFVFRTETHGGNIHVFDILRATTMRRSSQFLATCSRVHNEGAKILYGEIEFRFTRFRQVRGNYWDSEWEAIGWKDVRRFLTSIGRTNLGLIRDMVITFHDADKPRPSYNVEATRFINDSHLIACLELLAEYAQLRQLKCIFRPKRAVTFQDARFLDTLADIKVDTLYLEEEGQHPFYHPDRWVQTQAREFLEDEMVRLKRLYPEKRRSGRI